MEQIFLNLLAEIPALARNAQAEAILHAALERTWWNGCLIGWLLGCAAMIAFRAVMMMIAYGVSNERDRAELRYWARWPFGKDQRKTSPGR